jgi:cytoskeletal protein CcmA (bactofilin family)
MQTPVKSAEPVIASARSSVLGNSLALRGELAGQEDLVIQGKFEGTISIAGQCLTVGPEGQVKADVQAARVVIEGSVTGNISARDRIEVRKTGRVMGDLAAPGIGIEEGAYVKGSIEILREEAPSVPPPAPVATLTRRVTTEADDDADEA